MPVSVFRKTRLRFVIATIVIVILLAAVCGQPPAASASLLAAAPGVQTLPPPWTPTKTFTPLPTTTPLPTLTAFPTQSVADLCAAFKIIVAPAADAPLHPGDAAVFEWKGIPPDLSMKLLITPPNSIDGLLAEVPIPGDGALPIPVAQLPGDGPYIWRAWLQHPRYGQICPQQGGFSLRTIRQF